MSGKAGARAASGLSGGFVSPKGKLKFNSEQARRTAAGAATGNITSTVRAVGGKGGDNFSTEIENTFEVRKAAKDVKGYLKPELPEIAPDPQIAKDAAAEEARRRARRVGLALLLTSQQGSSTLGMG